MAGRQTTWVRCNANDFTRTSSKYYGGIALIVGNKTSFRRRDTTPNYDANTTDTEEIARLTVYGRSRTREYQCAYL